MVVLAGVVEGDVVTAGAVVVVAAAVVELTPVVVAATVVDLADVAVVEGEAVAGALGPLNRFMRLPAPHVNTPSPGHLNEQSPSGLGPDPALRSTPHRHSWPYSIPIRQHRTVYSTGDESYTHQHS